MEYRPKTGRTCKVHMASVPPVAPPRQHLRGFSISDGAPLDGLGPSTGRQQNLARNSRKLQSSNEESPSPSSPALLETGSKPPADNDGSNQVRTNKLVGGEDL
ncbi:OLC1v1035188C1 [Oldenlandia corymbosa var. corymbosa]|uniref:OLC1v1035188C1 n=1 Tax=Oldenlandia corymbosa var. corymbosa TaxID=529605 RepID=A0AAV1CTQ0_OLDCO|nr:OLC1v1035188C1 [Oldenlandia corymbosa var. corymbosa]